MTPTKRLTIPVIYALAAFAALATTQPSTTNAIETASPYVEIAAFTEALHVIMHRHVNQANFKELIDAAIEGMAVSLDPYSQFLHADDLNVFTDDSEGNLSGIGIVVSKIDDHWFINYPMPGSPAFQAGIRANDEILAVNGIASDEFNFEDALNHIRGEAGTVVVLSILRSGEPEPKDITIRRATFSIPTVQSAQILTNSIGYAAIVKFGEQTPNEFYATLQNQRKQNLKGYILDLRDNPGGLLYAAVAVADALLPENKLIVYTVGRVEAEDNEVFKTKTHDFLEGIPLVILINEGSASAAEVLAGAIRDNHRGTIIGERSFGKAAVQSLFHLETRPDEAILLTTARYFTPASNLIHGAGIIPDIHVPQTAEDFHAATLKRIFNTHPELYHPEDATSIQAASDAPLEAAIEHITNQNTTTQPE